MTDIPVRIMTVKMDIPLSVYTGSSDPAAGGPGLA